MIYSILINSAAILSMRLNKVTDVFLGIIDVAEEIMKTLFLFFFPWCTWQIHFSVWLVLKTKSCRCNEINPLEEVSLIQFKIALVVIVNSHFTWNWKLSSTLGQVKGPSPHTATISSYGNSLIKSCRPLGLNCRPQRLSLVHRFAPSCSLT